MKRYIKSTSDTFEELSRNINWDNIIRITMYLHPISFSDVNPSRVINGPLSEYGEELETPIKQEYDAFIEDCVELVSMFGFTITARNRSEDSGKSEYLLKLGVNRYRS